MTPTAQLGKDQQGPVMLASDWAVWLYLRAMALIRSVLRSDGFLLLLDKFCLACAVGRLRAV